MVSVFSITTAPIQFYSTACNPIFFVFVFFSKKKKEEKEDSSCFHSHSLGLKFIRSILLCGISILHLATPDDDADDDKNENRKMALKLFNVSADPRRKTKTKIDNQLKRNVFGT